MDTAKYPVKYTGPTPQWNSARFPAPPPVYWPRLKGPDLEGMCQQLTVLLLTTKLTWWKTQGTEPVDSGLAGLRLRLTLRAKFYTEAYNAQAGGLPSMEV